MSNKQNMYCHAYWHASICHLLVFSDHLPFLRPVLTLKFQQTKQTKKEQVFMYCCIVEGNSWKCNQIKLQKVTCFALFPQEDHTLSSQGNQANVILVLTGKMASQHVQMLCCSGWTLYNKMLYFLCKLYLSQCFQVMLLKKRLRKHCDLNLPYILIPPSLTTISCPFSVIFRSTHLCCLYQG